MDKRLCANCGEHDPTRFENETFTLTHAGHSTEIKGFSGWRCGACDEIEFDPASALQFAAVGDELVMRTRELDRAEIRRIRRKLGLSQTMAARLTGGGHNAFSRYERGEAVPLPAVVNLFKLLDHHPELLKELV